MSTLMPVSVTQNETKWKLGSKTIHIRSQLLHAAYIRQIFSHKHKQTFALSVPMRRLQVTFFQFFLVFGRFFCRSKNHQKSDSSKTRPKSSHNRHPPPPWPPETAFVKKNIDFQSNFGGHFPWKINAKIDAEFEAAKVMKIDEKSIRKRSRNLSEIAWKTDHVRKVPNAK